MLGGNRQEGAVAPLFAIMLVMFFAAGAIAIDLGGAWETKRDLITDLDAAALAGARAAALDPSDCTAVRDAAEDLLLENNPDADLSKLTVDCPVTIEGPTGYVRVESSQESLVSLGRISRDDNIQVAGASAARYGPVQVASNLKPLIVCHEYPGVADLLDDPEAYFALDSKPPVFLPVNNTHPDPVVEAECGTPPSLWGWTCFTASPCNSNSAQEYVENGYQGNVDVGTADESGDCDADTPTPDNCLAQTGSLGGAPADEAEKQICPAATPAAECEHTWTIVIYDEYIDNPGKDYYTPYAFVSLVVRDVQLTGNPDDRGLTVEFVQLVLSGSLNPDAEVTNMGTELCYGDSDPDGPAVTCDF